MSTVKVIEVIAQSNKSWDDAVQNALQETAKTVRNIKSIYVNDMQGIVKDNKITEYRVNTKISFVIDAQ